MPRGMARAAVTTLSRVLRRAARGGRMGDAHGAAPSGTQLSRKVVRRYAKKQRQARAGEADTLALAAR